MPQTIKSDVKQARQEIKKKLNASVDKLKSFEDVKKLLKDILALIK